MSAFSFLKNNGFSSAYCWVLKNNPTLSFYEKTGAKVTKEVKVDKIGDTLVEEVACVWSHDLSSL